MGFFGKVMRLARTLWHVPPFALFWRVRAMVMRRYYASPLYGAWGLAAEQTGVVPEIGWVGVELIPADAAAGRAMAKGSFSFAGETRHLGALPLNWLPEKASPLWVFHLHYHEWLADLKAAGAREAAQGLVADWLVTFGSYHPLAWHPYPTSLRLVAWLTHGKWLMENADVELREAFGRCLAAQALYLQENCEWDLEGNHLLKNLKALVYCGLALPDQKVMYERGLGGFLRELKRQILPDGTHFERSPLYMAQVLRDVLEVRALLRKEGGGGSKMLDEACMRLGTALGTLTMPDGGLTLFNDSAELAGGYVGQLLRLSGAEEAVEILPQGGYARLERGKAVAVFDAGRVGPDENPGHAHADTLSFELSYGRERVIVNSGTFGYQHRLRNKLRGTAAHSTVEVEGEDSAEVWAGHRVGRRPERVQLSVKGIASGEVVAEGSHDGYRHLGVTHVRKLVMAGDGSRVRGEDLLLGRKRGRRRRVAAYFHIHPAVQVRLASETEAELTLAGGLKARFVVESGRLDVRDGIYCPAFGVMQANRELVVRGSVGERDCKLEWQVMFT